MKQFLFAAMLLAVFSCGRKENKLEDIAVSPGYELGYQYMELGKDLYKKEMMEYANEQQADSAFNVDRCTILNRVHKNR